MPKPSKGETRKEFVSRCIPIVKKEDSKLTTKQAAGKCYGIYDGKSKKDLELTEQAQIVRGAWSSAFGNEDPYSWCSSVFATYCIVRMSGKFIQVPYVLEGQEVTFDLEAAQLVEHTWTPSARRLIPCPVRAVEDVPGRYKAYAIRFGDSKHRDAYGTWFNKDTDFCLDWYATRPWLYHHAQNSFIGTRKIGNWDEVDMDDEGLFFVGELLEREKYLGAIQALQQEDLLYPSSGTLSYVASPPDETGYIGLWPIEELSSTVAPAEYRIKPISSKAAEAIRTLRR